MTRPPKNHSGSGARQTGDYEVGYGRPPVHSRFKPGGVGNPKGRPKRKKTAGQMIDDALMMKFRVEENGRSKSMTAQEYMLRNLVRAAAQGNLKAILTVLTLHERYKDSDQTVLDVNELAPEDREILDKYRAKQPVQVAEPSPAGGARKTTDTVEAVDTTACSKLPRSEDNQT